MFKKVLIVLSAVLVLLLISVPFPGVKYTLASEATGNLTAGMETGITGVLKSAPIASPAAGSYSASQSVTLTASGSIAIYYTTDGTTPACGTGIQYTTAISVTSTTTITGIACYGDGSSGPVASYTYTITASGGGGGGGGGGEPPAGTTNVMGHVTMNGLFVDTVTCTTEDGLCTLTIPRRTIGLTKDLRPLTKITMLPMDEPPPPPEGANIIGLTYNFEPSGATFDPPITLEYTYDPATLPEGVAEGDLVVAIYDEATGEWIELDCVVDPVTKTITASVSHFTAFAIIAITAPVTEPEPEPVPPAPAPVIEPEPEPVPPAPAPVIKPEPEPAPPAPEPVVAEPEPVPPAPEPEPTNWLLIGGIIAVVVIVGLGIFLLVSRRRG